MPEMPYPSAGETIFDEWGDAITDRSVQRYADATARTANHSSPTPGDLSYLQNTGDIDVYHSGAWRHLGAQVGAVQMHAGGPVPPGWLVCDGSPVSRTTYQALFAQIGTAWGAGDGSTTFNVPDMRERVPRGVAASGTGDAVGEKFGADTHVHTGPSHVHAGPSHAHGLQGNTATGGAHSHGLSSGFAKLANETANTHIHRVSAPTWTLNRTRTGDLFPNSVTAEADDGVGLGGNTESGGGHTHSVAALNSEAGGTQNTGASGTASTGSASTIQKSAAIHFIIRA